MNKEDEKISLDLSDEFFELLSNIHYPNIEIPSYYFTNALPNDELLESIKYLAGQTTELSKIFQEFSFEISTNVYEYFKQYEKTEKQFANLLIRLKWPPLIDFDMGVMKYIISIYEKDGLKAIESHVNKMFLDYYTEKIIREKLDKWKKRRILNHRVPILDKIIQAHLEGNYLLSIPSILPQIDGFIYGCNYFKEKSWMEFKKLKKFIEQSSDNNIPADKVLKTFYTDILLEMYYYGDSVSSINRHAILHGVDVDYGTEVNSLKLILLFDYLQYHYSYVSLKNINTIHRVGCGYLKNSKREKEFFSLDTDLSNFHRCKTCFS